jgi:hypothetical protein
VKIENNPAYFHDKYLKLLRLFIRQEKYDEFVILGLARNQPGLSVLPAYWLRAPPGKALALLKNSTLP